MDQQSKPSMFSFLIIWVGQAFSLLGSRIVQFALVWWLTQLTGSATVLATASIVALLPEIVLGPLAGAYVDRWNRRTVMIVADGAIALASIWLAYTFWIGATQVWHVYVIMLVRAIGGSFHWPAMQASTTLMVPKEHLARVAGLNQTLFGVLNIAGPPLGALLMELLPLHGVVLVDVSTAAVAIFCLLLVQIPQPRRADLGADKPSIWADLQGGMRYIARWPGMMVLIGSAMIFKIALTPATSLMPLLVSDHFNGGAAELSLLEAIVGIGIVVGGVILSIWGGFRRKILTTLSGMVILGVSFGVLGLLPATWFSMALGSGFVAGLMIPFIDGPINAILQATVAPEMQGRVFTLIGSLISITSPFGLSIAGPVSDALGLQMWYVVAGVLCGMIGLAGFFIPALVRIEENAGGSAVRGEALAPAEAEI